MVQGWYAVETKPRKTPLVLAHFTHEGISHYQPRLETPGRRGTRTVDLFPGYLFAHLDSVEDSVRVRYTPGVKRLVGEGVPTRVDDGLVDEIRAREADDGVIRPSMLWEFSRGDIGVVRGGAFEGLEAVFQGYLPGRQRIEILLTLMGREVITVIPADRLMRQYA